MTPSEIINKVKSIKPSVLDDSALLSFLNTCEAKVRLIINNQTEFTPFEFENIGTDTLFLEEMFSDLYLYYLASQIDYFTNDIASYNNSITLYNKVLADYSNYIAYRRTTSPTYKYDYEGAFSK